MLYGCHCSGQVPPIDSFTFTRLTPVNCQNWCDTNMYAVVILKVRSNSNPCWVERSFDLQHWQRISTIPIVGEGEHWEVGFYVRPEETMAFYRLAM